MPCCCSLEESQRRFAHSQSVSTAHLLQVLCSVPSVKQALSEVQRVLKPGGKFLFVEHVLAPDRSLRVMQHILNPLQQAAADGCHLDRNTLAAIKAAGFASVGADSFVVPNLGLIGPHTAGIAEMRR